jgi:Signal transduction histidine kinase
VKKNKTGLARQYRPAFLEYAKGGGERSLQRAYEIGRWAIERGFGLLDLVIIHQKILDETLCKVRSTKGAARWAKLGAKFLIECLSSYEMVQMGFTDAIASLKRGTAELSEANVQLEKEVTERKQVEAALRRANLALQKEILERKKVEKEVLEISEKEQRRFGAELHDNLCQKLVGISMLMRGLTRTRPSNLQPLTAEIEKIAKLLNQSIQDARIMAHGFYPVDLEANALMISLRELAQRIETNYKLSCKFHCPQAILLRDNNVATHLFRIAQEAINNALKHGNAHSVQVTLAKRAGRIVLTVRDDGQGFARKDKKPKGIGMQIMKYRARMIDADLQFGSNGRGVELTCTVPLRKSK